MRSNIQDLPFINDMYIHGDSLEICDPANDAAHKRLVDLTIDEAIAFRQADFFPNEDDKRMYPLSMMVDPMFRRALWALTEAHPKTISSNNRFVAVALGAMICNDLHSYDMYQIKERYTFATNSDDSYLFNAADTHVQIEQHGGLKRINIGFTLREHDRIDVLSDELGITTSGLMLVFFWMGLKTSTKTNEIFGAYADTIIAQFKRHIKKRLYDLKFDPEKV